jgi:hypothetical protein
MPRKQMMKAAAVTLAGLGALVGLAVGSSGSAPKLVAQRQQPVEVRTEIIRKTVNVYRRAKPHQVAATGGGAGASGAGSGASGTAASARTRSSGVHPALVGSSTPAPRTRTSGASSNSGSGAPQRSSAPTVRTRASGVHSAPGSSAPHSPSSSPVKTRTSGASAGGGSGSGARPVSTRSSGGGEKSDHHDD